MSPALVHSGFHSLDGARYLLRQGWPVRICALVAHHSGAGFLAADAQIVRELATFEQEDSSVTDALAYADQTVGPTGERLTLMERFDESLHRYGPTEADARRARLPYLQHVEARVAARLRLRSCS